MSLYSTQEQGTFKFGIARWVEEPFYKARLVNIVTLDMNGMGSQNIDLSERSIDVDTGDFIAILAKGDNPAYISFMQKEDDFSSRRDAQLVLKWDSPDDFGIGYEIDINDEFVQERKVFALSFTVDNADKQEPQGNL